MGNAPSDRGSEDIEARLAFMEKTLDELSDVIARQDREIDRLKSQVAMLLTREKDRDAEGGGGVILGDERPPHY